MAWLSFITACVTFAVCAPFQCRVEAHDTAHGWTYPPACCRGHGQGGDCDAIPHSDVTKSRSGYSIILQPGDHFRATRPHRFFVPYGDELPSGDGDFHVCLHPSEDNLNCFFAPPDSV